MESRSDFARNGAPAPPEGIAEATIKSEHASEKDCDDKKEADEEEPVKGKDEEVPTSTAQATDFPEGGWRGWGTVAGAFLIQFCGFGYTGSFGVYQAYYVQTYLANESASAISWIGGMNAFLVISSGLVTGRLYDKGYFYYLLIGGSILYSFSLFMLSLAQPDHYYQVFLCQGLGMGLGAGTVYVSSVAVVSHYFVKWRALAMTIVASGSSLGAVIHPIMLNNTLNGWLGFGNAVRASAGLVTGLLLIACLLMRPRLPPSKHTITIAQAARKFSRDPAYIFATIGLSLFTIAFYYPLFYIQLDASVHGLSSTFSFYSLVILNSASFVGRLAPGFLAHSFGVANMITIAVLGCSILLFVMIAVKSVASVVVVGIIYGFFAGNYITLMAPLMAVLSDNMSELGVRMGLAFAFSGIGGLVGGAISGALLTSKYIWWRPAVFSGALGMFATASFAAMTFCLARKARTAKRRPEAEP
ncbi:Aspyridones efflux protein [Sparassis crispa]|uniref:Aspyridones efflux protein n=1 Tax=Sparassis crispa TaxID=139825 RepID=A0A401GYQ4_9APHY|nr:Aspyridones efflux protein [Sparassis crispa]GBE87290.1 Aspyridones efflux protein [Sparassis crispa]